MDGDGPMSGAAGNERDTGNPVRRLRELEAILAAAGEGIYGLDRDERITFVNPAAARMIGCTPTEAIGASMHALTHHSRADGRPYPAAECPVHAAISDGTAREAGDEVFWRVDGTSFPVEYIATPIVEDGQITGAVVTFNDVTERREAEQARAAAAAEHAAREAAETAAARLRGMVGGLAAIVWEADPATLQFTFVSERAEDLLGYPTSQWMADPAFWPSIIHPDDREETVRLCRRGTGEGRDHDFSYRAITADGRVRWLHDVVHVVCDAEGTPRELLGVMTDITEQKRREQAAALLAEAGRMLTEPGTVEDRLSAAAALTIGEVCDVAIVRMRDDDARYRAVAAAPPAAGRHVLALPPVTLTDELETGLRTGRAVVLPEIDEELLRAATDGEAHYQGVAALGPHRALLAPLITDGHVVGSLNLAVTGDRREYDDADLALAENLGQRMAATVAAERVAARQRHLQHITAALASADGLHEVARALTTGLGDAFGASGRGVHVVDPERRVLRLVDAVGYPADGLDEFTTIRLEDPLPVADAARTGEPVWLRDRGDWAARYPHLVGAVEDIGHHAMAALPLRIAGRVLGVLTATFRTTREFSPDERAFALTLVGLGAQAFQRAADADQRRTIAETLQHSLLPPALPDLPRLAVATRYLPGAEGVEAGGDWYEVLDLDPDHVALVVGDVVGQGAPAAAVMGQLRSALAGSLLQGQSPAQALEHLDRFAGRIPGARASTVAVLILDTATGDLAWACAGHPPPLVVDLDGTPRYLLEGHGACLGVSPRARYREGRTHLAPGSGVLLYSDGLVERRGEVIDEGLDRLSATAAELVAATPAVMADRLVEHMLAGRGSADDLALIIARLLPPPLRLTVPALATELIRVRRRVRAWAVEAGLSEEAVEDLVQCVDEATANCAEHAYPDRPGDMEVELSASPTGEIHTRITDFGRWRPPPANKGYRGYGLDLLGKIAEHLDISTSSAGTTVNLRYLPVQLLAADGRKALRASGGSKPDAPSGEPAQLILRDEDGHRDGQRHLRLRGDLDLYGARAVRAALLDQLEPGTVTVLELPPACHLASNGVALLTEAADAAHAADGTLRLVVTAGSSAHRVLMLGGLTDVVDVQLVTH